MTKLTKTQREWLDRLTSGGWKITDICSGGASQCITRLQNKGFVGVNRDEDWRLSTYFVTDAGHAALDN